MLELKEHQIYGSEWLAGRKFALLADEMGVGKTGQAIRACDLLTAETIAVLCPAIATTNWRREFELFEIYNRPIKIIETGQDCAIRNGVNIVSFNLASTPRIYQQLAATKPDVLIVDEFHYVKNYDALRTKVVFGSKRKPHIVGLSNFSERTYGLSATPMPRDPGDLWVPLHFFGAYPKSYTSFKKEFCKGYIGDHGFIITGVKNVKRLKSLLKQIMLRRRLKDIMDKEIPVYIDHFSISAGEVNDEDLFGINNGPNSTNMGKVDRGTEQVDNALKAGSADSIISALKGLKITRGAPVSTLRRHTGLYKVDGVAAFVKEKLDGGVENVVIFAIHKRVIENLFMKLKDYNPVTIYGGTKQNKKDAKVLRFERGRSRVAILNIGAAGTAIRFKASKMVVFAEPDWNPDNNAQAIGRCLWLEREDPLQVWYLSLVDSYDEQVNRVLTRKTVINNQIFNNGDSTDG